MRHRHILTLTATVVALATAGCAQEPDASDSEAARAAAIELGGRLDGSVVFQRADGIYVVRIGEFEPRRLAAPGTYPRWAPDGRAVAFVRGNEIMQVQADGSNLRMLATTRRGKAVACHPNGKDVLFTDIDAIKAVDLESGEIRTLVTGTEFFGLDISAAGDRLVATVKRRGYEVRAFDLTEDRSWTLGSGCSGSLSPDAELASNNMGGHHRLALRRWGNGEIAATLHAPKGTAFDNHFWSNAPDWLACIREGKETDILIHQVSSDRSTQVTFRGDADRPDLFVRPPGRQEGAGGPP